MSKKSPKNQKKQKVTPAIAVTQVGGARDFFAAELRSVMEKRRIEAKQDSFDYLVELLVRFMEADTYFAQGPDGKRVDHFLVGLYGEYVQGSPQTKRLALRRLGDVCMMVTGFFPDSLSRKLVDVDYYFGMGGAAYWQLSQAQLGSALFAELSVKFRTFSEVLAEMSSRSGLQTNSDVLRLYERWLYSGSDRLRDLLAEQGIRTPVSLDVKTKH